MLNLYSVYSASNDRRLCALLCPAISFLHFHVLQIGPSISRPSFSRPAFSAPPKQLEASKQTTLNTFARGQHQQAATGRPRPLMPRWVAIAIGLWYRKSERWQTWPTMFLFFALGL